MATTNSAPHRHTHPSLTRTRRPKKLPAPSPSATRSFWDRFFRHARLLPASFVIPRRLLSLAARWLYVTVARMPLASQSPLLLPPPSTQGAQGRSPPRCAISRPGRIFTCDRFGSGKSRWVEPPALDLTKPVPCRRCAPSPRVTLATRLTGSFFHRA